MFPQQWSSPCGNQCTHKYAALMQIPWRVFCKKGCNADGETWEECLGECNEICYKDPVFKDQQWSAYIDRSPGPDNYSVECFHACVAGCGYKFSIPSETVDQVHPKRPAKPCSVYGGDGSTTFVFSMPLIIIIVLHVGPIIDEVVIGVKKIEIPWALPWTAYRRKNVHHLLSVGQCSICAALLEGGD